MITCVNSKGAIMTDFRKYTIQKKQQLKLLKSNVPTRVLNGLI